MIIKSPRFLHKEIISRFQLFAMKNQEKFQKRDTKGKPEAQASGVSCKYAFTQRLTSA